MIPGTLPRPRHLVRPVGSWEVEPVQDLGVEIVRCEPEHADYWGLYFYSPECMESPEGGPCHRWHADFADAETAEHVAGVLNGQQFHPLHD